MKSYTNNSYEMATSPAFTHPTLHTTSNEFRLLQILRDTSTEPIRCLLTTCAMDHAPAYVALSYTWGPEHPQKTIEINGSEFSIRQNLFDFLAVARSKYRGNTFWIDQICIDQGDVGEKNHQVSLMSRIYTEAACVVAWLGAEGEDSDVAVSYIEGLSQSTVSAYTRLQHPREYDALKALFARPYWRRLWIIQEVVLARNVTFLCGARQLSWLAVKTFAHGWHVTRNIRAHVTTLFSIHDDGDLQSSSARSHWLGSYTRGYDATGSLRELVYRSCDFECSDPRDKIYAVMGIYKNRWIIGTRSPRLNKASVDIDYNKPVETVFWDFFTTHLDGVHFVQHNKIRSPLALSMKEVMDGWWQYAMRLMNGMELNCYALRKDVASVLERKFQELQRDLVADGSLRTYEQEDASDFFAKKLQTVGTWTSQ